MDSTSKARSTPDLSSELNDDLSGGAGKPFKKKSDLRFPQSKNINKHHPFFIFFLFILQTEHIFFPQKHTLFLMTQTKKPQTLHVGMKLGTLSSSRISLDLKRLI